MKIDINDPRITAFALGELSGDDAIELARAVRSDGRIRRAVDEVRETAQLLGTVLSPAGAEMLTSKQRDAVRSVAAMPEITDIASARVPWWKKPAVVATGVAAAVAVTLFLVVDRPPVKDDALANQPFEWNWSQMETSDLISPVVVDSGYVTNPAPASEAALAVSAAMSDDTAGYRDTVKKRIESIDMKLVGDLPELDTRDWIEVTSSRTLSVPLSSGAASWPWVRRYVMDAAKLPPKKAVRIEEMINQFSYVKPEMLDDGGLIADMEFSRNPWNSQTCLLAVHLMAKPGAEVRNLSASLVINPQYVDKVRLLGYARVVANSGAGDSELRAAPAVASRSRGNYVLYEVVLRPGQSPDAAGSVVSLSLGEGQSIPAKTPKDWVKSSPDIRFASVIAAMGMLLSDYPAAGELDSMRLASMLESIKALDGQSLSSERSEALELIAKVPGIVDKVTD